MNKQKKTKEIAFRILAILLAALMVLGVATSLLYKLIGA